MQSQKLPLWQLFYSPAQNNGISHRPASPSTAHTYAPAYRLYDKAVRIAADGFRFLRRGIPARHYPSRGSPDPPAASLLPGKPGSVPGITPFRETLGP